MLPIVPYFAVNEGRVPFNQLQSATIDVRMHVMKLSSYAHLSVSVLAKEIGLTFMWMGDSIQKGKTRALRGELQILEVEKSFPPLLELMLCWYKFHLEPETWKLLMSRWM